jgi:hypothetical protein
MSVYRVVLRAWHGEWNGVRLWTRERFFDETAREETGPVSDASARRDGRAFSFSSSRFVAAPGKKKTSRKKANRNVLFASDIQGR